MLTLDPQTTTALAIIVVSAVIVVGGMIAFRFAQQARIDRETAELRAALRAYHGMVIGIEPIVAEWLEIDLTVGRKLRLINAGIDWSVATMPETMMMSDEALETMAVVYEDRDLGRARRRLFG